MYSNNQSVEGELSPYLQQTPTLHQHYTPRIETATPPESEADRVSRMEGLRGRKQQVAGLKDHRIERKRSVSPALSTVTARTDEYIRDLEDTLMKENKNLKEHNAYLVSQITKMIQRERKYKKAHKINKEHILGLEQVNAHLEAQLYTLTSSIVTEISKLQKIVERDKQAFEDELNLSASMGQKSEGGLGWETESTLHLNLQSLKHRVQQIGKSHELQSSSLPVPTPIKRQQAHHWNLHQQQQQGHLKNEQWQFIDHVPGASPNGRRSSRFASKKR